MRQFDQHEISNKTLQSRMDRMPAACPGPDLAFALTSTHFMSQDRHSWQIHSGPPLPRSAPTAALHHQFARACALPIRQIQLIGFSDGSGNLSANTDITGSPRNQIPLSKRVIPSGLRSPRPLWRSAPATWQCRATGAPPRSAAPVRACNIQPDCRRWCSAAACPMAQSGSPASGTRCIRPMHEAVLRQAHQHASGEILIALQHIHVLRS